MPRNMVIVCICNSRNILAKTKLIKFRARSTKTPLLEERSEILVLMDFSTMVTSTFLSIKLVCSSTQALSLITGIDLTNQMSQIPMQQQRGVSIWLIRKICSYHRSKIIHHTKNKSKMNKIKSHQISHKCKLTVTQITYFPVSPTNKCLRSLQCR
jgi:hypothetical protein